MTREQAKELLPIITAFANDEEIQIRVGEKWLKSPDAPLFNDEPSEYRIKPKPREFWICRDNGCSWAVIENEPIGKWDQVVKLREIID